MITTHPFKDSPMTMEERKSSEKAPRARGLRNALLALMIGAVWPISFFFFELARPYCTGFLQCNRGDWVFLVPFPALTLCAVYLVFTQKTARWAFPLGLVVGIVLFLIFFVLTIDIWAHIR